MEKSETAQVRYNRRLSGLKLERESFTNHWTELSDFILPRRGRFLTTDRNRGSKKTSKSLDDTATLAVRTLVSGMVSGMTSPARPWFRLGAPISDLMENASVKMWLDEVEELMREIFSRSNLYNALPQMYEELAVFGTAAMLVVEDYEDVIRCHPYTIGEYYIGTNQRGEVDTVYREMSMTVAQVINTFGKENCSTSVRDRWESGAVDTWVDVIHVIEPNDERNPKLSDAKNMPYVSVYYAPKGELDRCLRKSGFQEFPAMAPRWNVMHPDIYGRSPGMESLGDVKQLQTEQKRKAQAIDKMSNPPLIGDGQLKTEVISVLPGGLSFADLSQSSPGLKPVYQVDPRINELMLDIQQTQERIERSFYADLFLMTARSDRRQVTAREINERHEEKLLAIGPVLSRTHSELLKPLIDRTFAIMFRAGIVPDPPQELQDTELRVEFISMLAQAQKSVDTGGIERLLGYVSNAAQFNPDILDKFDFDQSVDHYSSLLGTMPDLVRDDEAVEEIRAARIAAQQQQMRAQMQANMAQSAKTLADADTSGKNALTDLVEMADRGEMPNAAA